MRTLKQMVKAGENQYNFVTRATMDFKFFVEHIIGDEFPPFVKEHIKQIINPANHEIAIVWPRGHSKSTTISINLALWYLFKEHNWNISVTSSSMTQSMRILEEIQLKITNNELLKNMIPPNRETSWNKTEMITTSMNKCFAKPFNDSARGEHVNLNICDDVLRAEGITQNQIKDIFWGIFYPYTQTRNGKQIIVGTPQTTDDLFTDVKEKGWVYIKQQAVIMDSGGNWLAPLWPQRFDLDKLRKIQEMMGGLIFSREYLCNPLAGGSKIFPAWLIQRQLKSVEFNKPSQGETYFLGMDIALSAEKGADFTVFTVIGKDDKNMMWIRKLERYKGMMTGDILKRANELNRIFDFRKIIVESSGLGKGLSMDMTNLELAPEIAPKTLTFATGKKNKEQILGSLQGQLMAGNLFLIDNEVLINELQCFDKVIEERTGKESYEGIGTHDDTVISLALAVNGATQMIGDYGLEFV